jgi:hypothetical protein
MDKPPPQEEETPLTSKGLTTFGVGLALYASGFALLARNHSDAAPVFIVAGILAMVSALL